MVAVCDCGEELTVNLEKTEADIEVVTTTSDQNVVKDYVQLSDVLTDGKTFHPTEDNPDGNDLLVEFSMLFNSSMSNFKVTNISFPGIYIYDSLASDKGAPVFWYYIKQNGDGITPGSYDDWTSNIVKNSSPYNSHATVEFDGWHRFGIRFHQNTKIDGQNVSYTMTVTMYIDGVRVYEAELDASNTYKTNSHYLRLYTAEVDADGNVTYTDNVSSYVSYYKYTAHVQSNGQTAYFVTGDKYITCGDEFVLDVERQDNPENAKIEVEEGVELDAKAYYTVK